MCLMRKQIALLALVSLVLGCGSVQENVRAPGYRQRVQASSSPFHRNVNVNVDSDYPLYPYSAAPMGGYGVPPTWTAQQEVDEMRAAGPFSVAVPGLDARLKNQDDKIGALRGAVGHQQQEICRLKKEGCKAPAKKDDAKNPSVGADVVGKPE